MDESRAAQARRWQQLLRSTGQELITFGQADEVGSVARLISAHQAGALIRVARGAYAPATALEAPTDPERRAKRYRLRVLAAAQRMKNPIFTGHSALAILGLPIVGLWPSDVFVLADRPHGTRRPGVVTLARRAEVPTTMVSGVAVTAVEYSLIQVARRAPLLPAMAAANAACFVSHYSRQPPLTTPEALWREHERLMPYQGSRPARQVLRRVNTQTESTLETVSDIAIEAFGLKQPIKQARLVLASGSECFIDYLWPDERIGGEADGESKYRGADSADRVIAEKHREDEVREVVPILVRWDWQAAWQRAPLGARLLRAGVPRTRRPLVL
ncbi:hypothetical protein [Ruania halotolerans]|uniref:hypothetical protein n=1 Tax=Ruania halotolerans TaxID=2897773 RepID=UPI001E453A74|nr:hypothetical protein [Ruania halotolerans]UFU06282.1 hypothetical protein LQF10_17945 [Ruania halotolerans]